MTFKIKEFIRSFLFIFLSFACHSTNAQNCIECKGYFDQLIQISNLTSINQPILEKSWELTSKLEEKRYTDYVQKNDDGLEYVSHTLTQVYSQICLKADKQLSVDYYLKYMLLTKGSAEEERSSALEKIFNKFPETFLKTVGDNKEIMDDLAYGFVYNREGLNKSNARLAFFKTNPTLKEKYNIYKNQIDYIIKTVELELEP